MLFVTATPIGNLSDASERLKTTLKEADLIAAEDTRKLRQLAGGLDIKLKAKVVSVNDTNEREQVEQLANLAKTSKVVLVSDAGMPTISDPGYNLVKHCHEIGVEVLHRWAECGELSFVSQWVANKSVLFRGLYSKKT